MDVINGKEWGYEGVQEQPVSSRWSSISHSTVTLERSLALVFFYAQILLIGADETWGTGTQEC